MTVCDKGGGGGVKNHQKKRDILYGRPLLWQIKVYVVYAINLYV